MFCSVITLFISIPALRHLDLFYRCLLFVFVLIFCLNTFILNESVWYLSFYGQMDLFNLFGVIALLKEAEHNKCFPLLYRKLKAFCKIFLLFQIPFSIVQYLEFGANDHVGGTYGLGGSGMLTCMCFLCVFFLIKSADKFDLARLEFDYNYKKVFLICVGLLPVFINETKISIFLIPVLFIGVVKFRKVSSLIFSTIIAATVLFLFSTFYSNDVRNSTSFSDIFHGDFVSEYLTGELDEKSGDFSDIPRFTKIVYAYEKFSSDVFVFFLGNDYGAFKGKSVVDQSTFSKEYSWLLYGSRPLIFNLFIMGGISLIILLLTVLIRYIKLKEGTKSVSVASLFFFYSLLVVLLLYNDSLLFLGFSAPFLLIVYCTKKLQNRKKIYEFKKRKAFDSYP